MGLVAKAFQDIITFSRATQTGTYVNSNGYITNSSVLNYLTYSNAPENAAWTKSNSFVQQNLLTYSQEFDNAAWTKNNATVTANLTIAPDGTLTADKIISNVGVFGTASQNPTVVVSTIYTYSIYAKAAEFGWLRVQVNLITGTRAAWFNLASGTVGTVQSSLTASIVSVGNGFYRCNITATADNISGSLFFGATTADNTSANGDGVSGIYAWGAQLVQGSVPGDYRATTSAALPCLYADYNGALRARKLCEDAANSQHFWFESTAVTAGVAYTFSFYVKAAEKTQIVYTWYTGGAAFAAGSATFNLSAGTATPSGAATANIVNLGNGYYRCTTSNVCTTTNAASVSYLSFTALTTYVGDGSSGIYIADAQLNDGSSATAYYETTANAYNAPRFDYDPVTLAPKGLLVEEQRVNLLLNSVLAGTGAAPTSFTQPVATGTSAPALSTRSGISAAYSQSATAQRPFLEQSVTTVATTVYTLSMNIEAVSGLTYNDIIAVSGLTPSPYRLNGVVVLGTDVAAVGKLEAVVTTSGVASLCRFGIGVAGNATGTLRFSCPQIELGSFATSYIPTVGSQVTRAADVASVNTLSPWFNQTGGTIYAEATRYNSAAPAGVAIEIGDGTSNNRYMIFAGSPFPDGSYAVTTGGVTQASISVVNGFPSNTVGKVAAAYAPNDFQQATNATLGAADTSGTLPSVTSALIGRNSAGTQWNGHLRRITYYPRRLTNAELQTLTTL